MERAQKTVAVTELQSELTKSKNAILFGFAGLKVPEVTELRRQVRGTHSRYLVVKNTLALRAARGTALEGIAKHFAGPTAVRPVEASEIKTIAELPSREELLARLVYLIQSPLTRLATVLAGPVANLARVLRAVAEKPKSGPADAAPAS